MKRIEPNAIRKLGRVLNIPYTKISAGSGDDPRVIRNNVHAMFIVSSGDARGDEPGLQSVASAMGTPYSRKASIGGACVSRNV